MLGIPHRDLNILESNTGTTSADPGVTVTAGGTIHTKGGWAQIIASSTQNAYGITCLISSIATTASTNFRTLVDIGIGAATEEIVLIPNLLAGGAAAQNAASNTGAAVYFFPIFIPKNSRISARMQSLVANKTGVVGVWLHESPSGPANWYGTRVTAYGINTTISSGTAHSHSNNSYANPTQIVDSCDNPIKFLQMGMDLGTVTNGVNSRGLIRIGVGGTPNYIASDLPINESTTLETCNFTNANFILSQMYFDIPQGTRLVISSMRGAASAARNHALYGVD
jgi:hypothetical protein